MAIRYILFDLDGTLLPMDQDVFVKKYFGLLAEFLAPYGYEPKKLVDSLWVGIKAMFVNDGRRFNEDVFWESFSRAYGADVRVDEHLFRKFYETKFDDVKEVCGINSKACETVMLAKELGFHVVLATNPLFPRVATHARIRWAGMEPSDFELCTTYEDTMHCKPNKDYYTEVVEKIGVEPEECLMVGNDIGDDVPATEIGMQFFLLTDCLINKQNCDISKYRQGNFDDLMEYIKNL